MKQFYLVGKNIKNSFSPRIHKIIYAELGIDAEYSLFEPGDNQLLLPKSFDGLNITHPFKQSILPLIDCDKSGCGSINTVKKVYDDNKSVLHGFSTDGDGFILDAKRLGLDISDVLILGAGGAAYSIAKALKKENSRLTVFSRNQIKAKAFADRFSAKTEEGNSLKKTNEGNIQNVKLFFKNIKNNNRYSLIINCTPLVLDFFKSEAYYDIKYNGGANGLGMLIFQAILSCNIFFDRGIDLNIFDHIYKSLKGE